MRFRSVKVQGVDLIDFVSSSLPSLSDGNTISETQWLRRGLPKLVDAAIVPRSKQIELISFLKPNGDCCFFSVVDLAGEPQFLIATRNMSVIVKDRQQLLKIEGKFSLHKDIGSLFFDQISSLSPKLLTNLKSDLTGKTWVG